MAKDGTSRGGARPGAGRKPKAITEKVADGNPGGRKLTVVDFGENAAELTGEEMPPVSEFMKAVQKDGRLDGALIIPPFYPIESLHFQQNLL